MEANPENEGIESKLDEQELLNHPDYKLNRYDFQEGFTRNPEDDQSSLIQKKAFKFRFRRARDSVELFEKRNQRMIRRQLERFHKKNISHVIDDVSRSLGKINESQQAQKELDYIHTIIDESVQQYKDYFESDKEEDFSVFNNLSQQDKVAFLSVFENHTISPASQDGFVSIPKRNWENAFGFWTNFLYDY